VVAAPAAQGLEGARERPEAEGPTAAREQREAQRPGAAWEPPEAEEREAAPQGVQPEAETVDATAPRRSSVSAGASARDRRSP
jgi:hypothetical protein